MHHAATRLYDGATIGDHGLNFVLQVSTGLNGRIQVSTDLLTG